MKHEEKKFDCVEMKNGVQAKLLREYNEKKDDFESYAEFIRSTADEDPSIAEFRKKMAQKPSNEKSA